MAQEQIIRSFYAALNSRDLGKFTSHFSDDGQFKDMSSGRIYRGKNEIRTMAEGWLKAFPDMRLELSSVIESGDVCCAELSMVGTHTGPLTGPQGEIPATGKKVNVPSCDTIRLRNGKVQSVNCYFSATVLLDQIGVTPSRLAA